MKKGFLLSLCVLAGLQGYNQTVTTLAGKAQLDGSDKFSGSDASYSEVYFNFPFGITIDGEGIIWVSQASKIVMLDNGTVRNRAGFYNKPYEGQGYMNGNGIAVRFSDATGIVANENDDLFIVDESNHAIRKMSKFINVNTQQSVQTWAGGAPQNNSGRPGTADGSMTSARFSYPKGIATDGKGNYYVTGWDKHVVRKISGGQVSTLAGKSGESGLTNGSGSAAKFYSPHSVAVYDNDHILVTDEFNYSIRKVNVNTGAVTTFAGDGSFGSKDGAAASAQFSSPRGIAVVGNAVYVCDGSRLRVIENGQVSTFAGSATADNQDGEGTQASFGQLNGITYDAANSCVYVTDVAFNQIRKVTVPSPSASLPLISIGNDVNLYPNPASESIVIQSVKRTGTSYEYEIMNSTGQLVDAGDNAFGSTLLLNQLPTGLYFITGTTGDGEVFRKKFFVK
jgi:hypothetical protein